MGLTVRSASQVSDPGQSDGGINPSLTAHILSGDDAPGQPPENSQNPPLPPNSGSVLESILNNRKTSSSQHLNVQAIPMKDSEKEGPGSDKIVNSFENESAHQSFVTAPNRSVKRPPSIYQQHEFVQLSSEILDHSNLQDSVQLLRVQLQQLRANLKRARADVAKEEAKIEQALRRTRQTGNPLGFDEWMLLVESTDHARDKLGPLEQDLDDLDFRLVPQEARLAKQGEKVQRLAKKLGTSQLAATTSSPSQNRPKSPEDSSSRATTGLFYEDSDSDSKHSYWDPDRDSDLPNNPAGPMKLAENNLVGDIAPDLNMDNRSFQSDPHRPKEIDPIELLVSKPPDPTETNADNVKRMGLEVMDQPSEPSLPVEPSSEAQVKQDNLSLKDWILSFLSERKFAPNEIYSQTLSANNIDQNCQATSKIDEDWVTIVHTDAEPSSLHNSQAVSVRSHVKCHQADWNSSPKPDYTSSAP